MRTEDWACQWCGYPLVSNSFGKIEKTYRQLKEERLHKPEEEPGPEREIEQIEVPEPEEEPEKEEEPKKKEEPIQEPEPESEIEQEIKLEEGVLDEAEAKTGTEPVPEMEIEQETEPVTESEPKLKPAEVELTASELYKAYENDDIAAGERFANKILRITGVVSLIDVKNRSDTHYIRLTGSEGDLMQSVQCMFDKKYASLLCQLEKGQVVTVQGRYNGSIIAMRMVECFLIL